MRLEGLLRRLLGAALARHLVGRLLALGNFGYASAGDSLGYAIGYALSRGTLLVSALLGVFVYKEFSGADCPTWTTQIIALLLFVTAILLEAFA